MGTSSLDIDRMVARPSWKVILLDLIESKKLDPWNIDIVEIADVFLKKIREIEKLDLIVQANVILAAAILLRYKSDYLRFLQYQEQMTDYITEEAPPLESDEIPQLTLSSRIPPKRQVTLDELVKEMEKVIKYDSDERLIHKTRGGIDTIIDLKLNGVDIEAKMELLVEKIRGSVDEEGWTLFSRLIDKREDRQELIYALMSVLHLTQNERIDIRQDKLFDEIFIRLISESGGSAKTKKQEPQEESSEDEAMIGEKDESGEELKEDQT
jgi:segregation and condensation protein A